MAKSLRIATWNANGLTNHVQEVILFLKHNKIDILLISESHATERTVVKIPYYTVYYANHPSGGAHGGSAIIIKNNLKHYATEPFITNKIQSATLKLQVFPLPLTIAAVYSPPRHMISTEEYQEFFSSLGSHFLVAGDWNAKHTAWGSRLITSKGKNLLQAIHNHSLNYLSTGEPTYWPTDGNKIPDLLDLAITKRIPGTNCDIESSFDLSSDHSPIIITISTEVIWKETPPRLCNRQTNWAYFQEVINRTINLNLRLKTPEEIEDAVQYLTELLQNAAWKATPIQDQKDNYTNIPLHIKELLLEKRRARRTWQRSRHPLDKTRLNRLTHRLHTAIQESRNESFEHYVKNMSPNDHSLWKATRKFKRPILQASPIRQTDGNWARSNDEKAQVFAEHLSKVFTPLDNTEHEEISSYLDAACQLSPPIKAFSPAEVLKEIKSMNSHKAPGYDLIVAEVLKNIPRKALVLITTIYNGMLRLCYYPIQWKFAQIIMVAKPGKAPTDVKSYRPISLLCILSKIFERLLLRRIKQTTPQEDLIPPHQFGFREKHSTIQQCHRIVNLIKESLEGKKICASVFLDVQQAFDKVWHQGLLYKLKKSLPSQIYLILKSYLTDRYFDIKISKNTSNYYQIKSGVPQGSVLGPYLYLIYTADIPTTNETHVATFADDTAIISIDQNPETASQKLQYHLNLLQEWLIKWKITVNSDKSTQITFTTRRCVCPQVTINSQPIPIRNEVKYLGLHLDQKLTWTNHIKAKKQQLVIKTRQMNWLINRKSQLSLKNKLTIYKTILVPIWSYGIELWGCAKPTNTKILQTYQSKTLRIMANAPWYVSNKTLHEDLKIPFISQVIEQHANKHRKRNLQHCNPLVQELNNQPLTNRRLRRMWPEDLIK